MKHGANIFGRNEKENCHIVKYYCKLFCKIVNINLGKIQKMRNMKSLHIFLIIIIKREEKFQVSLWEDGRSKVTFGI